MTGIKILGLAAALAGAGDIVGADIGSILKLGATGALAVAVVILYRDSWKRQQVADANAERRQEKFEAVVSANTAAFSVNSEVGRQVIASNGQVITAIEKCKGHL